MRGPAWQKCRPSLTDLIMPHRGSFEVQRDMGGHWMASRRLGRALFHAATARLGIIVLITDGSPTCASCAASAAAAAKNAGVTVIGVGVDTGLCHCPCPCLSSGDKSIKQMVSDPKDDNYVRVDDFDKLVEHATAAKKDGPRRKERLRIFQPKRPPRAPAHADLDNRRLRM